MNYKARMILIKIIVKILGIFAVLSMCSYIILIIMTFTTNVYDMAIITGLFVVSMTDMLLYFISMNKIIKKYNDIDNLECYKNYIKEMIDLLPLLNGSRLTAIVIVAFMIEIIAYAIWWYISDIWIIEAILYYVLLISYSIANILAIAKFSKNYKYFYNRLHNEVYKNER